MNSSQLVSYRFCNQCGTRFEKAVNVSWNNWRNRCKFCSVKCANEAKKGIPISAEHLAKKKLQVPWNKGLKGVQVAWNKGKSYPQVFGEKNGMWKGRNATMVAHHNWIKRQLGSQQKCELCGTTEKRMYHWANISHMYKRDVSDYMRVCVPCHKKYDLSKIKEEGRTIISLEKNIHGKRS